MDADILKPIPTYKTYAAIASLIAYMALGKLEYLQAFFIAACNLVG